MSIKLLKADKRTQNIFGMSSGVIYFPVPDREGVYVFDKKSRITFKFGSVIEAMMLQDKHLIIIGRGQVWSNDRFGRPDVTDCDADLPNIMQLVKLFY